NDERKRTLGSFTFENQYLNGGVDYLDSKDKLTATAIDAHGKGWSVWATPRYPMPNGSSLGAPVRLRHPAPNTSNLLAPVATSPLPGITVFNDQKQNRTIVGGAYWFPHQGNVSAAILVDYDGQHFKNITTAPTKTVGVHGLLNF